MLLKVLLSPYSGGWVRDLLVWNLAWRYRCCWVLESSLLWDNADSQWRRTKLNPHLPDFSLRLGNVPNRVSGIRLAPLGLIRRLTAHGQNSEIALRSHSPEHSVQPGGELRDHHPPCLLITSRSASPDFAAF